MKIHPWLLAAVLANLFLPSCQPSTPSVPVFTQPASSTAAMATSFDPSSTIPPTSPLATLTPTMDDTLNPSLEEPSSPAAQAMLQKSLADLAVRLSIGQDQIQVISITSVTWRDASLGCPKPAIDYIQVLTPGFRISLEVSGQVYEYHTDTYRRLVLCR